MTVKKEDPDELTLEQIKRAPTWVKAAVGMAGAATAGLIVAQLLRNRRDVLASGSRSVGRSKVTFAEVGGHDDLKRQIEKRIITPFREPSLYERFKRRAGGGILMYGPPGCGKTLLARATAGQCNANFINVATSDVLDMWLGESERKISEIFARARAAAPAVLFFDEFDGLAASRHRETTHSSIVSQFLTELDGFAKSNRGVLVLGATNVPWTIDPAFRRPGRFDRVLFVPPPDRAARAAILKVQLAGKPTTGDIDLEWIAESTTGFSGADLELLVEEATDAAIEASLAAGIDVPVCAAHLRESLRHAKPTTSEWFVIIRDQARSNEGGQYDEVLRFLHENPMTSGRNEKHDADATSRAPHAESRSGRTG
jgi:transitional endoplasmic reticulum ATPase